MTQPDVTVVVAVYNTMPDLTTCLTSLVEQTIGLDRLEVVAVDDGSTDGGGAELDRFAEAYPGTVKVLHQANSGGPAAPSNRALDHATGRYVFFIGADDHLGPEALQRMVDAADRWGSDVLLGRTVGVNKRYIHQEIFDQTCPEVDLFTSALPFSLSNTKLFRRELVEKYGLRFPEDMPVGSDQPFTLEACLRAGRISVLADYDYYYAVKRLNAGNITYRSDHLARLDCVERIVHFAAEQIEPGDRRDAVLRRHFAWEIAKLLRADFLKLGRDSQERVRNGVGKLARQYLTDQIRDQLDVTSRIRIGTAAHGSLGDLLAVIRQDVDDGLPPMVLQGDRWFAVYPGFGDPRSGLSDEWFELTNPSARWLARLDTVSVRMTVDADGERVLAVTARSPRPDLSELVGGVLAVRAGGAEATVRPLGQDPMGTTVHATFRVRDLLAELAPEGGHRVVRAWAAGATGDGTPLRGPRPPVVQRVLHRDGGQLHLITATTNHKGQLVFAASPVTLRRMMARLRRRLPLGGK
ncbi:glycosyltransferase involved in cell wall biosynthesis [Micromonospora kangleipakensis]|uniref:Glycosyltransferase involved in cell wall biosynthesis n=1 Tax=Micromonospora kangleipakensis TaxID=1077942 RepID=A0A4Q8BBS1_9ACTN|nr:glycosyltransferase [Micromonospora kangleipakensis]RZU74553.1 glycosyltransferase involved in cell wall biosynthesis [Micromonospora kangleipakensis]